MQTPPSSATGLTPKLGSASTVNDDNDTNDEHTTRVANRAKMFSGSLPSSFGSFDRFYSSLRTSEIQQRQKQMESLQQMREYRGSDENVDRYGCLRLEQKQKQFNSARQFYGADLEQYEAWRKRQSDQRRSITSQSQEGVEGKQLYDDDFVEAESKGMQFDDFCGAGTEVDSQLNRELFPSDTRHVPISPENHEKHYEESGVGAVSPASVQGTNPPANFDTDGDPKEKREGAVVTPSSFDITPCSELRPSIAGEDSELKAISTLEMSDVPTVFDKNTDKRSSSPISELANAIVDISIDSPSHHTSTEDVRNTSSMTCETPAASDNLSAIPTTADEGILQGPELVQTSAESMSEFPLPAEEACTDDHGTEPRPQPQSQPSSENALPQPRDITTPDLSTQPSNETSDQSPSPGVNPTELAQVSPECTPAGAHERMSPEPAYTQPDIEIVGKCSPLADEANVSDQNKCFSPIDLDENSPKEIQEIALPLPELAHLEMETTDDEDLSSPEEVSSGGTDTNPLLLPEENIPIMANGTARSEADQPQSRNEVMDTSMSVGEDAPSEGESLSPSSVMVGNGKTLTSDPEQVHSETMNEIESIPAEHSGAESLNQLSTTIQEETSSDSCDGNPQVQCNTILSNTMVEDDNSPPKETILDRPGDETPTPTILQENAPSPEPTSPKRGTVVNEGDALNEDESCGVSDRSPSPKHFLEDVADEANDEQLPQLESIQSSNETMLESTLLSSGENDDDATTILSENPPSQEHEGSNPRAVDECQLDATAACTDGEHPTVLPITSFVTTPEEIQDEMTSQPMDQCPSLSEDTSDNNINMSISEISVENIASTQEQNGNISTVESSSIAVRDPSSILPQCIPPHADNPDLELEPSLSFAEGVDKSVEQVDGETPSHSSTCLSASIEAEPEHVRFGIQTPNDPSDSETVQSQLQIPDGLLENKSVQPKLGGLDEPFGIEPPQQKLEGFDEPFSIDPPQQKSEGLDEPFGIGPPQQKSEDLDEPLDIEPPQQKLEGLDEAFGIEPPQQKLEGLDEPVSIEPPQQKLEGLDEPFSNEPPQQNLEGLNTCIPLNVKYHDGDNRVMSTSPKLDVSNVSLQLESVQLTAPIDNNESSKDEARDSHRFPNAAPGDVPGTSPPLPRDGMRTECKPLLSNNETIDGCPSPHKYSSNDDGYSDPTFTESQGSSIIGGCDEMMSEIEADQSIVEAVESLEERAHCDTETCALTLPSSNPASMQGPEKLPQAEDHGLALECPLTEDVVIGHSEHPISSHELLQGTAASGILSKTEAGSKSCEADSEYIFPYGANSNPRENMNPSEPFSEEPVLTHAQVGAESLSSVQLAADSMEKCDLEDETLRDIGGESFSQFNPDHEPTCHDPANSFENTEEYSKPVQACYDMPPVLTSAPSGVGSMDEGSSADEEMQDNNINLISSTFPVSESSQMQTHSDQLPEFGPARLCAEPTVELRSPTEDKQEYALNLIPPQTQVDETPLLRAPTEISNNGPTVPSDTVLSDGDRNASLSPIPSSGSDMVWAHDGVVQQREFAQPNADVADGHASAVGDMSGKVENPPVPSSMPDTPLLQTHGETTSENPIPTKKAQLVSRIPASGKKIKKKNPQSQPQPNAVTNLSVNTKNTSLVISSVTRRAQFPKEPNRLRSHLPSPSKSTCRDLTRRKAIQAEKNIPVSDIDAELDMLLTGSNGADSRRSKLVKPKSVRSGVVEPTSNGFTNRRSGTARPELAHKEPALPPPKRKPRVSRLGQLKRQKNTRIKYSNIPNIAGSNSSVCSGRTDERNSETIKCRDPLCKWIPNLYPTRGACERCWSLASDAEQKDFINNGGRHLRIALVKGGCPYSCNLFTDRLLSYDEDNNLFDEAVRICQRCFNDLHYVGAR